jgi:hypothetical protein
MSIVAEAGIAGVVFCWILFVLSDESDDDELDQIEFLERMHEIFVDESTDRVNEFLEYDTDSPFETARIPKMYEEFSDVFSKTIAEELPPLDSKYQCHIRLKDSAVLPKPRKPYSLSLPEKMALQKFVVDNLRTGFIRKSSSPIAMGPFASRRRMGNIELW